MSGFQPSNSEMDEDNHSDAIAAREVTNVMFLIKQQVRINISNEVIQCVLEIDSMNIPNNWPNGELTV